MVYMENINNGRPSLGQIIALIHNEKKHGGLRKFKLTQKEEELIEELRNRANVLMDNSFSLNNLQDDKLWNDLIISIFINSSYEKESFEKIKSINSNFHLFEKVNQVFMDYLLKSQSIKGVL